MVRVSKFDKDQHWLEGKTDQEAKAVVKQEGAETGGRET